MISDYRFVGNLHYLCSEIWCLGLMALGEKGTGCESRTDGAAVCPMMKNTLTRPLRDVPTARDGVGREWCEITG